MTPGLPPSAELDATERAAFERLKARLAGLWSELFPEDEAHYTSVVIPSSLVEPGDPGAGFQEERLLFLLMRLRNPRARMVFVTSRPIHPLVLEYHLELLWGIPASHARQRLTLLCAHDSTPRPLSAKILERPRLVERIRSAIFDPARAYLTVRESTPLERRLAIALDLPLNAVDPSLSRLAGPEGSREVFRQAGVSVGEPGEGLSTASAEFRINPRGRVFAVSTHDHVPDEPSGRSLEGLRFPAFAGYRRTLEDCGRRVADVLAIRGVVSRVGVTFEVRRRESGWSLAGLGLDLGMGPASHPFLALRFLTGGALGEAGQFRTPTGGQKAYRSTDRLGAGRYRGLLPEDLIDIVTAHHLRFDPLSETGVLFHEIGGLSELGSVGLVAIGNDRADADRIYEHAVAVLDGETSQFLRPRSPIA